MFQKFALSLIAVSFFQFQAVADCYEIPTIEEAFAKSEKVVIAKVISKQAHPEYEDDFAHIYTMEVTKTYKGTSTTTVEVASVGAEVCTSYSMEVGESHLLWLDDEDSEVVGGKVIPWVTSCGLEGLASDSQEEIEWLEKNSKTESR